MRRGRRATTRERAATAGGRARRPSRPRSRRSWPASGWIGASPWWPTSPGRRPPQLIAAGRVLVDGSPVSVGRDAAPRGGHAHRSCCRRRETPGWRPSPACASRSSTPTTRWPWSTSRRGWSCTRVPGTTRGPWSAGCWPASPTWPSWWRPGCARPTGPASCTGSTRAPRASSPWPGPRRPTGRSSTSWPPGRWSAATWPWWRATWPRTGARWRRPIGRSARTPTKMAVTASGKPARTAYTVVERRGGGDGRRPCSSSRSRAGGPIRYASTWRPSGTPWWGMPATGCRTSASGAGASSCTPSSSRSRTRAPGRRMEFTSPLPEDLKDYLG